MDRDQISQSLDETLSSVIGPNWKQISLADWFSIVQTKYPEDEVNWMGDLSQVQGLCTMIHFCTLKYLEQKAEIHGN